VLPPQGQARVSVSFRFWVRWQRSEREAGAWGRPRLQRGTSHSERHTRAASRTTPALRVTMPCLGCPAAVPRLTARKTTFFYRSKWVPVQPIRRPTARRECCRPRASAPRSTVRATVTYLAECGFQDAALGCQGVLAIIGLAERRRCCWSVSARGLWGATGGTNGTRGVSHATAGSPCPSRDRCRSPACAPTRWARR
jgi:hypothetical protein